MWMPPIATLGRVRWPLRGSSLFAFGCGDDHKAAHTDVDGLAGGDAPWCGQLRTVDPCVGHASDVAQPVVVLLVGDARVLARHGKIGELDGHLFAAIYRRGWLRYVVGCPRSALRHYS